MNDGEKRKLEGHINEIKMRLKKIEENGKIHILDQSGSVFYTGYGTLLDPNGVYFLGINPGGNPRENPETVEENLSNVLNKRRYYNAYDAKEDWEGSKVQDAVVDIFKKLEISLKKTCASNLVYERSIDTKSLENKTVKFNSSIYIHDYIINNILNPSVIISFGSHAYNTIKKSWIDDKKESEALNTCYKNGSPCYYESMSGDKLLVYIPHTSHSHYKKFSQCMHAIEIIRSIIQEKLKIRREKLAIGDKSNLPKWKFKNSWQSLFPKSKR